MKRTLGDMESIPEGDETALAKAPKLKRAQTDFGVSNPRVADIVATKDGILKQQNRSLNMELSRRKREAEQLRQELGASVGRERAKEAAFLASEAVLSELEAAVKALMYASDPAASAPSASASSVASNFLSLGEHPIVDRAELRTLQLGVDEWCAAETYSEAGLSSVEIEVAEEIKKSLSARIGFLQHALKRLTQALSIPSSAFESSCAMMLKNAEAEKMSMQAELSRLKSAVNDLAHRLFSSEKRRRKAEKEVDANLLRLDADAAAGAALMVAQPAPEMSVNTAVTSETTSNDASSLEDKRNASGVSLDVTEKLESMKNEISVLTEQLSDTEKRRAAAERRLNEHLISRGDEDVGVEESQQILESMKEKFIEHIELLQEEAVKLRSRLRAAEAALVSVEQISSRKIEELSAATAAEVSRLSSALEEKEAKLVSAEAENSGLRDLKLQAAELHFMVDSLRAECNGLRDQKKKLVSVMERLENNLSQSRAREIALGSGGSASDLSSREADLEMELEDAKAQMGDLFLEIEAVVNSEEKSREQCARVLQQLSDNQRQHHGVLEENARLTHESRSLKNKLKDAETRASSMQLMNTQLDGLLIQVKNSESKLFSDHNRDKHTLSELESKIKNLESTLLEVQSKTVSEKNRCEVLKKKWALLTERVTAVTSELENERKKRLKYEAQAKKEKSAGLGDAPSLQRSSSMTSQGSDGGDHNQQLLDVTLDMLRCSVCRDRFKAVAITRCFHLFCKECIDENLRNRHRKCPACGEKFGQDDVRQVYFTH